MKRIPVVLASLFIASVVFAQNAEKVMSLDESVSLGLKNNQTLLALLERVQLSEERVTEAKSNILPKIDLNFNASEFDNQASPSILSPSFDSVYLPQNKSDQYFSTRLSMWQFLYNGGRYTTTITLAETNLSQATSEAEIERNAVTRDIKLAYYEFLAQSERVKAYEASLAQAQKGRTSAEEISSLQHGLLAEKHNLGKVRLRYLSAIGMELTAEVEVKGMLCAPYGALDVDKGIAWAFQYRPELRQTQFQEKIDSLRVNLSLTERLPTISLGANYEWVGDQFPLSQKNWNTTINFNVPIFDGWATWSRIKQHRIQTREAKIRRAAIEDQVRLQVRDASLDYEFWKGQCSAIDELTTPDIQKGLQNKLQNIEILKESLKAQSVLEWTVGTSLK